MKVTKLYALILLLGGSLGASLGLMQKQQEPDRQPPELPPIVDQKDDDDPRNFKYARGYRPPEDLERRHRAAAMRNGGRVFGLPKATAAEYDCRTLGIVPPIRNQGSCGSCWDFAGTGIATCAMFKAGQLQNDGMTHLSEQCILDCARSGGCNGDDHSTVFEYMMNVGLPTAKDYGPYTARTGRCSQNGSQKVYKFKEWGYCSPDAQRGIARTQDVKNCIVAYGPVSVAVAANSGWDNYRGGVYNGTGARGVNHEVMIVGWKDDPSIRAGGYWIMRNSWGEQWGDKGYMNIAYGADMIGVEAAWCSAQALPPPPPPPPGPGPIEGNIFNLPNGLPPGQYQIIPYSPPKEQPGGKGVEKMRMHR